VYHRSVPETVADEVTEEERTVYDVAEAVRIGLILVALALNVWLMWDYVRDQPEWSIAKRRLGQWWHKVVVTPENVRKMERQAVFQAMQIVDGET
jgi:hypothetical protein